MEIEIRDQSHLMDASGTQDEKPSEAEIANALLKRGWLASDIEIFYDDLMGFWRWSSDILAVEKEN